MALVGPSGAGKSTILQLMLRFYDPNSGSIRLDGTDIRECATGPAGILAWYLDPIFLSGTILDNLLLGNLEATPDQITACLQQAHAWDFIQQLPDGINTELGEHGTRLSGGQRQRL